MFEWLLAVALTLSAPVAATEPDSALLPPILRLPPELQAQLHASVLSGQTRPSQRLERLVDFVFDAQGLGMSYREGANHTVAQSFATREANCMGFTLLFLALAREAGLDAFPQEITETLSWSRHDGTVYRNRHVNAGVRIGGRRFTVDVARDAVVARHPPEAISDQRLLAGYYNNLAMDRLANGEFAAALQLMDTVLALEPMLASHWSNVGVLHLRSGDATAAERSYRHALALDPRHADALFNMVSLAQRTGDRRQESEFRRRLVRVQQRDPFHHFLLAMDYERAGDYRRAIDHYRRAIRWHRREHRFHAALANAYLQLGDTSHAIQALTRAQAHSSGETQAMYRTRVEGLRFPEP